MDILVLRNCNGKPFEVCMYIIDSNEHHLKSLVWYVKSHIP